MFGLRTLPFIAVVLVSCGDHGTPDINRKPAKFVVPADYEGVVITVFGQPGFPELPIRDGFRLHEYPPDGILVTSSTRSAYGRASDETLRRLDDGSVRPISGAFTFEVLGEEGEGARRAVDYVLIRVGSDEYWGKKSPDSFFSERIAEAKQKIARNDRDGGQAPPSNP